MENQITKIDPKQFGLEENQAENITKGLQPFLTERELLISEFDTLSKVEISKESIPKFKELRLKISKNRTQGIETWRKANKEFFLRGGQFVDSIARRETQINESMEEFLFKGENHFIEIEKQRILTLENERKQQLLKFSDVLPMGIGIMEQGVFDAYLSSQESAYNLRIEAEKQAEIERIEYKRKLDLHDLRKNKCIRLVEYIKKFESVYFGEMSEDDFTKMVNSAIELRTKKDAEIEAQRLENEKLKQQAIEKEKADEIERKKQADIQAKKDAETKRIQDEKDAEIKRQYDILKQKEAEENRLEQQAIEKDKAQKEAEKQALKAPDKEKINNVIKSLSLPNLELKSEESKVIYGVINAQFDKFITLANYQISTL